MTWFVVEAEVLDPFTLNTYPLRVRSARLREDMDANTFASGTVTVDWVDGQTWGALDPRGQDPLLTPIFSIRATQYEGDPDAPTITGNLPDPTIYGGWARMWIRQVSRDFINREVTIDFAGGESMLADKLRLADSPIDTGATTVGALLLWSLYDVFGAASTEFHPGTSIPIPAGDQRMMNPGESHLQLIKPALDMVNSRLIDKWGQGWQTYYRDTYLDLVLSLATYTQAEGAPAGSLPIVIEMRENVTRDGEYADGVLLKYDNTSNGGTVAYWRSGSGVNTKGVVYTYNRGRPGTNSADNVVARTLRRGRTITVTARAMLDVRARSRISVHTRTAALPTNMAVRAVEWNTETGLMTLTCETEAA